MALLSLFSICCLVGSAATPPAPAVVGNYCAFPINNAGFETGNFMYWSTSGAPVVLNTGGHSGSHSAQLGGRDNAVDRVWQVIGCPYRAGQLRLGVHVFMHTSETANQGYDVLEVVFTNNQGTTNGTYVWNDMGPKDTWIELSSPMGGPFCEPGVTWEVYFRAVTDSSNPTWFLVDDVSFEICCYDDSYEPNDNFAAARVVAPGSYDLRLCPSGDEDWFSFYASAGQPISLQLGILEAGQPSVCLVSPSGQEVTCASQSYPNTANLSSTATESGLWRARVHDPGYTTGAGQLRLDIGLGAAPSATPSATPGPSPQSSSSPSPTASASRSQTASPTRTATRTATLEPELSLTPGGDATATATPEPEASETREGEATSTRTPSQTRTQTRTPTAWPDLVPRLYLPVIRRPGPSTSPTFTRTPTRTATSGSAPTRTATRTRTKTSTPAPVNVVIDASCSQFDAPGNDATNLNGEWVCFRNVGDDAANLHNWHVRDQEGYNTLLWEVVLQPGASVRLHSGTGTDTASDIYWGSDEEIWDNAGDTVYLYDAGFDLVDQYSY